MTVKHRSVSQLKTYEQCPHQYKLQRIDKVWQRPAAWLAQGTAVHAAAEAYGKGEVTTLEAAKEVFVESYTEAISKSAITTPDMDYWFASGRYRGEEDTERRFGIGLEQVEKVVSWMDNHAEDFWVTPSGEPAVELGFDIDLSGVRVRGFIDAVVVDPNRGLVVRDIKTGLQPGDDFQLGVYAVALEVQYGIKPLWGDYWMAKSGKPTYPYDLSVWTVERVTEKFHELDRNIKAERFDPIIGDHCNRCDVATSCRFVGVGV